MSYVPQNITIEPIRHSVWAEEALLMLIKELVDHLDQHDPRDEYEIMLKTLARDTLKRGGIMALCAYYAHSPIGLPELPVALRTLPTNLRGSDLS